MTSNLKKRMREQEHTQTDMKQFGKLVLGRKNYVATPEEKGVTAETNTRSCNPLKKDAPTP